MSAAQPLKGIGLIDCAKANALQGVETAAERCGYGSDVEESRTQLIQAGQEIGVDLSGLKDLVTARQTARAEGEVIRPHTPGSL